MLWWRAASTELARAGSWSKHRWDCTEKCAWRQRWCRLRLAHAETTWLQKSWGCVGPFHFLTHRPVKEPFGGLKGNSLTTGKAKSSPLLSGVAAVGGDLLSGLVGVYLFHTCHYFWMWLEITFSYANWDDITEQKVFHPTYLQIGTDAGLFWCCKIWICCSQMLSECSSRLNWWVHSLYLNCNISS